MLLFIDGLLTLTINPKNKVKCAVFMFLVAIFIGGNNYVTALLTVEICVLFCVYCYFYRKDLFILASTVTVVLLTSFFVSVFAPGNSVRQSQLEKMTPLKTICSSIVQVFLDIPNWRTAIIIVCLLVALPYLYKIAVESKYSFSHPFLVQIVIFLLYASQNAPHFYAAGEVGPGRLRNIVYYSLVWFLLISVFYWCGYLKRRSRTVERKRNLQCIGILSVVVLILFSMYFKNECEFTTINAIMDISDGSAGRFDKEVNERIEILSNPDVKEVVVLPIKERTRLLFWVECVADPEQWMNVAISKFYGKTSVRCSE